MITVRANAFLDVSKDAVGAEEVRAATRVLRSGWLTMGPQVRAFEEELRAYLGAPHVLAVSSCTAALHLSLLSAGVGSGDEVITTPLSFAATANAVVHAGAVPVFCDVDPETYNLDPSGVAKKVTRRTKAVIPVHLAGLPCEVPRLRQLGVTVIEDAAHAIGAEYRGKKVGILSPFTCFSFYATKNMTSIEGGAIAVKSGRAADRIRRLRVHGLSVDTLKRHDSPFSPVEMDEPGFKYNMSDVQAAVGRVQLRRLEGLIKKRRALVDCYRRALDGLPLKLPAEPAHVRHAWHIFIVRLIPPYHRRRNRIAAELKRRGIGVSLHYQPIHLYRFYRRRYGYRPGDFPVAEELARQILTLPLHPRMKKADVQRVAAELGKLIA